jgi:hypothetical protein
MRIVLHIKNIDIDTTAGTRGVEAWNVSGKDKKRRHERRID